MFGSTILEVAIGLGFVFLLVSMICSAIREGLEARLKTRAAYLERGIRDLLHDPRGRGLARSLYEHPLIFSLYSAEYRPGAGGQPKPGLLASGVGMPSYIPARSFALALLDIAARGPDPALASDHRAPVLSLDTVRANVINLECEPVQRALLTAIDTAQGSLDAAVQNLEAWFESGMDRVSGWYKRSTQWILFWTGLLVAVVVNVNTITIAAFLHRDDTARAAIVARAEAVSADTAFVRRGFEAARQELEALRLPIGWSQGWGAPRPASGPGDIWNGLLGPILGWLATAFAATVGAPFWFDLLNRFMVVRSTVKPRPKPEDPAPPPPKHAAGTAAPVPVSHPATPAATPTPVAAPVDALAARSALEDACDIPITRITRDEELPAAEGGVA